MVAGVQSDNEEDSMLRIAIITFLLVMVTALIGVFIGFFGEDLFGMSEQTKLITTWTFFGAAGAFVVSTFLIEIQFNKVLKEHKVTSSGG